MSTRPSDWSPLTGGDPCPGDPGAWDAVKDFWAQRSADIDGYREKLNQHTSIDGEGNSIRRLESAFSDGASMASLISYEFEKASDAARSWQRKLEDMQSRADEALRKAQAAKTAQDDAQTKIDGLKAEAAKDDSPDPIIAVKLHGLFGGGGLEGEIADAKADIEAAQKTVDGIRDEYVRESGVAVGGYELSSVEGIYKDFPRGNPFSKPFDIVDSLGVEDTQYLRMLESKASGNPDALKKYLDALGDLSTNELSEYFASHPDSAKYPLSVSGETVDNTLVVKAWWGRLNKDQRATLIEVAPGIIGNLNGVTYDARDKANRWLLKRAMADSNLRPETQTLLDDLLKSSIGKDGEPPRYITSLDLSNLKTENEDNYSYNDVLASISLESLDDADKVSIIVPGMTNNVSSMSDLTIAGLNMYNEQRFAVHDHGEGNQQIAVNLWIGYETPPGVGDQLQHRDKLVTDVNWHVKEVRGLQTILMV